MDFNRLKTSVSSGKFYPIYYLAGEEPYYIDKITQMLESTVLDEGLKSFNQDIVYGADMSAGKLNSLLRSYPVMSNHRLVILKEAQKMKKQEWDALIPYFEKPAPTTIFVIAFKDKKMDGRMKLGKMLKDGAHIVTLESKKLYENNMPAFIEDILRQHQLEADAESLQLLVGAYGTNLSLIEKEVEKLSIQLKFLKKKKITKDFIYDYVNIDRDFNVFELQDAIGQKNLYKSIQIIDHLVRNPKENPTTQILHNIFSYFNKLAICKHRKAENENEIASILNLHPFVAKNYKPGLRNFSMTRLRENIIHIGEADLYIKGVRRTHMEDEHVLKTLVNQLIR